MAKTVKTATTGAGIAKQVNARLKAAGREERLVAGRGYCYFVGGDAMSWYTSSVPVCYISDLTVDRWLEEHAYFVKANA